MCRYESVELADDRLRIRLPRGNHIDPWRTLEAWFRGLVRQDIVERVEERRQMRRMQFGRRSFNWRLVVAPPGVLDR